MNEGFAPEGHGDLTAREIKSMYAMIQSAGWRVFTEKWIPAVQRDLGQAALNNVSTDDMVNRYRGDNARLVKLASQFADSLEQIIQGIEAENAKKA